MKNSVKKSKNKKNLKINKAKVNKKLTLKKDKIENSASRNINKKESNEAFDKIKYQTLEAPKLEQICSFSNHTNNQGVSPTMQNTQEKKTSVILSKHGSDFSIIPPSNTENKIEPKVPQMNTDFLSFVEKHEQMYKSNKDRRLLQKDSSIGSTNTKMTTNINNVSKKTTVIKPNRPFSGDTIKQGCKGKRLVKKKLPLSRPKTAKGLQPTLEKSEEKKCSLLQSK